MIISLTSAIPLSKAQRDTLLPVLLKKHAEAEVREVVDESVIGGVKVTVGSTQYDATVRGKLHQVKHTL